MLGYINIQKRNEITEFNKAKILCLFGYAIRQIKFSTMRLSTNTCSLKSTKSKIHVAEITVEC